MSSPHRSSVASITSAAPLVVIATADQSPAARGLAVELGRPLVLLSPDQLGQAAQLDEALVLSHGPDEQAMLLAELAGHGLFRTTAADAPSGAITVARRTAGETVAFYERLAARLRREVDVYHTVSREYQALALTRDRELDRSLEPTPSPQAPPLRPATPVSVLAADLAQLRARFAPPASLRTRALDAAAGLGHAAATALFRLFDQRDALLDRLRKARRAP